MTRDQRSKYINLSELKKRGWTTTKINAWLGEPDARTLNPKYASASPQKLYLIRRVKQQERNKRFQDWLNATNTRRQKLSVSLKRKNTAKKDELQRKISSLEITIPKMKKTQLYQNAVKHYNLLWLARGDFEKSASIKDDEEFLKRISVNMLRHAYSKYEPELQKLVGKTGADEARVLLKQRINQEIARTYPYLKATNQDQVAQ